jgi:hypothetical protein
MGGHIHWSRFDRSHSSDKQSSIESRSTSSSGFPGRKFSVHRRRGPGPCSRFDASPGRDRGFGMGRSQHETGCRSTVAPGSDNSSHCQSESHAGYNRWMHGNEGKHLIPSVLSSQSWKYIRLDLQEYGIESGRRLIMQGGPQLNDWSVSNWSFAFVRDSPRDLSRIRHYRFLSIKGSVLEIVAIPKSHPLLHCSLCTLDSINLRCHDSSANQSATRDDHSIVFNQAACRG